MLCVDNKVFLVLLLRGLQEDHPPPDDVRLGVRGLQGSTASWDAADWDPGASPDPDLWFHVVLVSASRGSKML